MKLEGVGESFGVFTGRNCWFFESKMGEKQLLDISFIERLTK